MALTETTAALLEAINSDVRKRVDEILDRLEVLMPELLDQMEMESVLEYALCEVTDAVAEGAVALVREVHREIDEPSDEPADEPNDGLP